MAGPRSHRHLPGAAAAAGLDRRRCPARLDAKARAVVEAAAAHLTEQVPGSNQLRVPPDFFPDPASVDTGIRGNLGELSGERFRELADYRPES